MENYEKQKIVTYYVCVCASTMLTTKIITKFIENHSRKAAMTMFQVDLDKLRNYL